MLILNLKILILKLLFFKLKNNEICSFEYKIQNLKSKNNLNEPNDSEQQKFYFDNICSNANPQFQFRNSKKL